MRDIVPQSKKCSFCNSGVKASKLTMWTVEDGKIASDLLISAPMLG